MRGWLRAQTIVLAGGMLFAWGTVVLDFRRYAQAGGALTRFGGTQFPNPLLTPCFYGAILFLIALAWAVTLPRQARDTQRRSQGQLVGMLIVGTLFAWGNFAIELVRYCAREEGAAYLSCSGTVAAHPVFTPCFVGAVLYATALGLAVAAWRALTHEASAAPPA